MHFCTYFDSHYLLQGLALLRSLEVWTRGDFRIWVLCLDEGVRRVLTGLRDPRIVCLPLWEIETWDSALATVKGSRSRVEYYWTLTPVLLLQLLERHPETEVLAYLDADLLFFSSPGPLLEELGRGSVLIIEHRFAPAHTHLENIAGRFNVGMVLFRNDHAARAVLNWWRGRCLEWCGAEAEVGKYGDQKYLDQWPAMFPGVVVSRHPGAGIGPWNLSRHHIRRYRGGVLTDGVPAVFYHYHKARSVGRCSLVPVSSPGDYGLNTPSSLWFHVAYARALHRAVGVVRRSGIAPPYAAMPRGHPSFLEGLACQSLVLAVPWPLAWSLWRAAARWTRGRRHWDASRDARRRADPQATRGGLLAALKATPEFLLLPGFIVELLRSLCLRRLKTLLRLPGGHS
jgi:hypothetical protein